MDARYLIRPAIPADAPALVPIEQTSFSDPWSEAAFRESLETPVGFGLVGEEQGQVVGYLIGRLVAGEGEVLNLAVAGAARRRGVGRALLSDALEVLAGRGAEIVFLEVRSSNQAAQELYRSAGFRVSGLRRRYYRHPVEDALILVRTLAPSA